MTLNLTKTKIIVFRNGGIVKQMEKWLYYIFIAILILFLVIFEDDKSDNFLRGDKSF